MIHNYITWKVVDELITIITASLTILKDELLFDEIIGLGRGGYIPAVLLSDYYCKPMHTLAVQNYEVGAYQQLLDVKLGVINGLDPQKRYLIVDDIYDTGATFATVVDYLASKNITNLVGAFLVSKASYFIYKNMPFVCGQYFARDQWIIFPWQKNEFAKAVEAGI